MNNQKLDNRSQSRRKSIKAGVLIGLGTVAAIDEIIFHQLLAWHHFYDISTPLIGLISDGILHAAELICLTAGFMALLNLQRKSELLSTQALAGFFCGVGAFQLFDGIVNHKILRIHQIRYGINVVPYDIVWNLIAVIFLLMGAWMIYRGNKLNTNE